MSRTVRRQGGLPTEGRRNDCNADNTVNSTRSNDRPLSLHSSIPVASSVTPRRLGWSISKSCVRWRVSLLHYDVQMTTFAESLKKEIARVARKELREEIAALRKTSLAHRSEIAALKKQQKAVQALLNRMNRVQGKGKAEKIRTAPLGEQESSVVQTKGKPGRKVVFTAERLKAQRARLGFTQEQMAKLLEVSSLSIWKWESGGASPRASRVPQILERLALGKREAESQIAA